jgi:hypothetical protein
MSAAAADEILLGHTGPWFNIMWSGLGANMAGPEVAAAYNKTVHWLRTVTRSWDGRFFNMAAWGSNPKPGQLNSCGAFLLNYCTGRRAIRITGKGMDESIWLRGKAARDVVDAGVIGDASQDTGTLLALLGSPFPPVRVRAAQLLAIKDVDVTEQIMKLLATGTTAERCGALRAINDLKIADAGDELMAIVRDDGDEPWIRQLAVNSLAGMEGAQKHVAELLGLIIADKPYDGAGNLDRALGSAFNKLAPDPYALGLDKDLLYSAAIKLLDDKHMWGRGTGMALLRNVPLEDFHLVADKIIYVIKDKDRTYTSYHGDGQRQAGLEILNRLNIKEAIDLTVGTIKEKVGRAGGRMRGRTRLLKTFGGEAKYAIPEIKKVLGKGADAIVKSIEESTTTRKMISLEDAKQVGAD